MLVVPYPLAFIYNYEFLSSASDIRFWGSLVLLLLLIIACSFLRRLQVAALFALALFVLFLLPALHLRAFNPFESLMHDRYLYLPSAGFLMLAGIAFSHFFERFRRSRTVIVAGLAAVTLVFGALTFYQNQKWRDDQTASEHALKYAPDWPFLRLHLGEVYEDQGRLDHAENEMKRAIEIDPTRPIGYATLANFYLKRGRHQEAEELFEQAVARGSRTVVTLNNRAGNLINLGRYQEASAILNNLLTEDPTNSTTNYNLGLIAERESRPDLAEAHYRKSISKNPGNIDSRSNLAAILVQQNRLPEAFEHISIVRSIAPDRQDILYTLAGAHLQARQCVQALGPLQQITSTAPTARAYMMAGLAYECLGRTQEARSSLEKVIEIAPDDPLADAARRRLQSTGGAK
jgi:pentatricopeptide repeat protein